MLPSQPRTLTTSLRLMPIFNLSYWSRLTSQSSFAKAGVARARNMAAVAKNLFMVVAPVGVLISSVSAVRRDRPGPVSILLAERTAEDDAVLALDEGRDEQGTEIRPFDFRAKPFCLIRSRSLVEAWDGDVDGGHLIARQRVRQPEHLADRLTDGADRITLVPGAVFPAIRWCENLIKLSRASALAGALECQPARAERAHSMAAVRATLQAYHLISESNPWSWRTTRSYLSNP